MISKTWSSTCYSSYEFDLVTEKVKIICATKMNCKYSILIWNFSQLKIDWLIWNFIELYIHFEHALWNLKFGEIKFPNFINMCHKIMILWHKFQISYIPTLLSLLLGYFLIQLKNFLFAAAGLQAYQETGLGISVQDCVGPFMLGRNENFL